MANSYEITPSTLLPLIGTPACPALVDVCIDADFALDPVLIPGAVRHPFDAPGSLLPRLTGRPAVVICQKGLKLSHGFAAWLRTGGIDAVALAGGMSAWRAMPAAPVIRGDATAPLWAVPDDATPDTAALRWLIRRWVAPTARLLSVPAAMRADVGARFAARPAWDGFGSALTEAGLSTPALSRMRELLISAPWLDTALRGTLPLGPGREAAENAIFDALHAGLAAEVTR